MGKSTLKSATSYEEQIRILAKRGCLIDDEKVCAELLAQVGYYRLSAYFLPFKTSTGSYQLGTNLRTVLCIYEFDRKLRNILFPAIEKTEVNIRARISYFHAHKYGALGYLDSDNFNDRHEHEIYVNHINAALRSNNKILFVKHHNEKYGGDFPVWVMFELFTFGMLSYFFSDLKRCDQKELADIISPGAYDRNITSWLRCCTDLRNICAHYGRLYFRIFSAVPARLPKEYQHVNRRLFSVIWALKKLYPDNNEWRREVIVPLSMLIDEYRDSINLNHIGFLEKWESSLLN